jgi:putative transposase
VGQLADGQDYIKVKGHWYYLYRAVDKTGRIIDVLLTAHRDEQTAKRFLTKAIRRHGVPKKTTIDGSGANAAAIRSYNTKHGTAIVIRPIKYLNKYWGARLSSRQADLTPDAGV